MTEFQILLAAQQRAFDRAYHAIRNLTSVDEFQPVTLPADVLPLPKKLSDDVAVLLEEHVKFVNDHVKGLEIEVCFGSNSEWKKAKVHSLTPFFFADQADAFLYVDLDGEEFPPIQVLYGKDKSWRIPVA